MSANLERAFVWAEAHGTVIEGKSHWDLEGAADLLNVDLATLQTWMAQALVGTVCVEGAVRISDSEILRLLQRASE